MLDNKTKIREHARLELVDIILIYEKEVKNEKVDRKVRDLEVLKEGLGKFYAQELDEDKYDEEEDTTESRSEGVNGIETNFGSTMHKNLFKLSDLNNREDRRKSKEKTKSLEDRFDLKDIVKESKKLRASIFGIIGYEVQLNKVNEGMESVQNDMCQQILELVNAIEAGKATRDGILKERIAPKGPADKIAKEQAHEQHKKEVFRLKVEIKKEIEINANKNSKKIMQLKKY